MGDVDRSRTHKVKAIFILGLNDGKFPGINKVEGFLNDLDRQVLKNINFNIAKTTIENLYEDNLNIYKALTTAEEKLYLSYASSDSEGKSLRASTIIFKIKKIFPELIEESDIILNNKNIATQEITFDNLLNNIRRFENGEQIEEKWFYVYEYYKKLDNWKVKLNNSLIALNYTNIPEKLSKENIEKLYGNTLRTSVSKLEKYRSCPFSYYLKYGLKLSDKNMFQIKSIDTGSFMHEVIDEFFKHLNENEINMHEIEERILKEIIDIVIEKKISEPKNYIFISTQKYKILVQKLKRVIHISIKYILYTIKQSKFEIFENEAEFKSNCKYEPIIMNLENNQTVEITGKIDRIDIANDENNRYVRIIDYKSSIKKINMEEVNNGLQIQLITYLDAICKKEEFEPAGILYFNLISPIIKSNRNLSNEEIEKEIRKKFKMQGLVLADVKVIKMMDTNLEKGYSQIIPVYLNKDSEISKEKSGAIEKEEFVNLRKQVNKIIKEISKEILSGKIDLKPYYNTKTKVSPCMYCEYKPICQFKPGMCENEYNFI